MNGGIVIQERRCSRCSNRRTVRMGTSNVAFCFNCRHKWAANGSTARRHEGAVVVMPAPYYTFGPGERERLNRYRAAVRAGLYTEWTEPEIAPPAEYDHPQ